MSALIEFPNVEALVVAKLSAHSRMAGVHVGTKVPSARPAEFVRIERVGGVRETLITEAATIVVEGWADTGMRAIELTNLAAAILQTDGESLKAGQEIGGLVTLEDQLSNMERRSRTMIVRAYLRR